MEKKMRVILNEKTGTLKRSEVRAYFEKLARASRAAVNGQSVKPAASRPTPVRRKA